jgi:outer membrane cobalamin receptor
VRSRAIVFAITVLASAPAAAAVRGVVRDPTGSPIEGASIVTRSTAPPPCSTRSAADGSFELSCAEPGAVLHIDAIGFEAVDLTSSARPLIAVLSPPSYSEAVVVTATRSENVRTSGAAPVTVLTSADLALTPPAPLDDALRLVPGFSLFRRTTSRAANPTTQGAGMRGLSASGASRALVLSDGVPLNDPFGGWVYWSRVPVTAVDRVEILRGGASDLYGADALAGVIQVLTRIPDGPAARVDLEAATHSSGRVSLYLSDARGPWRISGAAETFSTDGYVLVPEDQRGAIDVNATQKYTSARLTPSYSPSAKFFVRATGDVYGEHRGNGTPLQTNSTDIRQLSIDLGGQAGGGTWEVAGQAGDQSYDQVFSSIAADRSAETLTSSQYVPAEQHGFSARWQRSWTAFDVLAGGDTRDVSATNIETSFAPSGASRGTTHTPGYQRTSGAYVQLTDRPSDAVTFSIGARGDLRQPSRDIGFLEGDSAFSPRGSVGWSVNPLVEIRGSVGWAFRAPTLNERYRGFRAGNVLTLPNANLLPESLRTEEGSVLLKPRAGSLRVTVYRNDLSDAVTNVTVTSTPALITRHRENVSSIAAFGVETEGEWRASSRVTVTGALAYTHSRFADYPPLDGLTVPQVPDWQGNVGVRGAGPFGTAISAEIRSFSSQFDDDRNTFVLNPGTIVNLTVLHPAGRRASAYVSVENLLNSDYDVGATPVRTIGQPFTFHAGLRIAAGR